MYGGGSENIQAEDLQYEDYFEILQILPARSRSRCTTQNIYSIRFKCFDTAQRPDLILEKCLEKLFEMILAGYTPKLIGLTIHPPSFLNPYTIPLRPIEQNSPSTIAAALDALRQSDDELDFFSANTIIKLNVVFPLTPSSLPGQNIGEGSCSRDVHHNIAIQRCSSLVFINNPNDNLCLPRAFYIGCVFYGILPRIPGFTSFENFCNHQNEHLPYVLQIIRDAGLCADLPSYGCKEASFLQRWGDNVFGQGTLRVVIISKEHQYKIIYKGETTSRNNIFLYLENGHYSFVSRIEQIYKAHAYCVDCESRVDIRRYHPRSCVACCYLCLRFGHGFPCTGNTPKPCPDCGFIFKNDDCFNTHKMTVLPPPPPGVKRDGRAGRSFRSICESRYICSNCHKIVVRRAGPHECRNNNNIQGSDNRSDIELFCRRCHGRHILTAPCYIQPINQIPTLPLVDDDPVADNWESLTEQLCNNPDQDSDSSRDSLQNIDEEDAQCIQNITTQNRNNGQIRTCRSRREIPNNKLRYMFWDTECTQERENRIPPLANPQIVAADDELSTPVPHEPILVVAELICVNCINAGFSSKASEQARLDDTNQRPQNCVCAPSISGPYMRRWCLFNENRPGEFIAGGRLLRFASYPTESSFSGMNQNQSQISQSPIAQMLDFLLEHGPQGVTTMALAHNFGRYDGHLVLREVYKRPHIRPRLVMQGLKIYALELCGSHQRRVIFKDSLNFLLCRLAECPRTFGLSNVADKPFFPYKFIKMTNLDMILPGLPPIEEYESEWMRTEERQNFQQWYETENRRLTTATDLMGRLSGFHLRRELLSYCRNDVAILAAACLHYRALILEKTSLDPFATAMTCAGLALKIFRTKHLRPDTMVHTPEGGLRRDQRASVEAIRYMRLYELLNPGVQIQTAEWSAGEATVEDSGYRLDGLIYRHPPLRPLAIEYMGCVWHGCDKCFRNRRDLRLGGREGPTMEDLFQRTQRRLYELREIHGFEVHVVWGCEFHEMLRKNRDLKKMYDQIDVPGPLDPRIDALRGGRVEPFQFSYECSPNEEIVYVDVVSLYPFIMKWRSFPVGHPIVLTREHLQNERLPWTNSSHCKFRGLIKCRVLPPQTLSLALLPYRTIDGRLVFPLCASCSDEMNIDNECSHIDWRKRSWIGTYTHDELLKALQLGYVVTDLFEIWNYERWTAPAVSQNRQTGCATNQTFTDPPLFEGYIDTFLKCKVEATGWPVHCRTETQHAEFLRQWNLREGIQLESIQLDQGSNPALRQIAKIMLNSLWGKLAQRPGNQRIVYTKNPAAFHRLLDDPTLDIIDFDHINEHIDRVVVRTKPEFAKASPTNNTVVAAYVTSLARLHLYEKLSEVEEKGGKNLYTDTDSNAHAIEIGRQAVTEGEWLGEMKREFLGRRIVKYAAGGAKNWGIYHTDLDGGDPKAELKIRGFTLHYEAQNVLTFDRVRSMVLNHFRMDSNYDLAELWENDAIPEQISVRQSTIRKNRMSELTTQRVIKNYKPVYNKGRLVTFDGQTLPRPFGWKNN